MNQKSFFLYSGLVFLLIFAGHTLRSIYKWDVAIEGFEIPLWVSWIAIVLSGILAYHAFELGGYFKK